MIGSILNEYGISWAIYRALYAGKLKILSALPETEALFEKRAAYPERLDLFEIDISRLQQFLRRLPGREQAKLTEEADQACVGRITGFSSVGLDYGFPVNWQLNPLTGRECDRKKKWYQIADFDKERGDIKAIWEISRFSHFLTFARAYLLTGNEKYYRAFSGQLADWLENNPYSYGANFKCGQECALRMANAMLAYTAFEGCGLIQKTDQDHMRILILRCYRKIRSNFFYADRCIKNNHTVSELMGMLIGAWCCREEKQLSYAIRRLNEVIDRQFSEDGGYTQHSFNYERLALQDIEVVLAMEPKTGNILGKAARSKVLNAARLMYQCQDECGDMPNYGSNDGALAFPVTSCGYRDFRPVVNAAWRLLTGESPYPEGIYEEEWLWFGGKRGKDVSGAQTGRQDRNGEEKLRRSSCFEQAGLYTLRKQNSWMMLVLQDYRSRPAHMDQLHADLWVRGINVLCDGGTFSYAESLGRELIANGSHNTAVYDGRLQMKQKGPFFLYGWTERGQIRGDRDSFYGEMQSKNGYTHSRAVKMIPGGYRVTDCIKGENGKRYEIRFHTPCEVRKKGAAVELVHRGAIVCTLRFSGPFRVARSVRSLYYLQSEPVYCVAVWGVIEDGTGKIETEIQIQGE